MRILRHLSEPGHTFTPPSLPPICSSNRTVPTIEDVIGKRNLLLSSLKLLELQCVGVRIVTRHLHLWSVGEQGEVWKVGYLLDKPWRVSPPAWEMVWGAGIGSCAREWGRRNRRCSCSSVQSSRRKSETFTSTNPPGPSNCRTGCSLGLRVFFLLRST